MQMALRNSRRLHQLTSTSGEEKEVEAEKDGVDDDDDDDDEVKEECAGLWDMGERNRVPSISGNASKMTSEERQTTHGSDVTRSLASRPRTIRLDWSVPCGPSSVVWTL